MLMKGISFLDSETFLFRETYKFYYFVFEILVLRNLVVLVLLLEFLKVHIFFYVGLGSKLLIFIVT